jgi:nucleoside phosphorylase
MTSILITSAFDPESDLLRERRQPHWEVVSLGVGALAAAARLAARLTQHQYARVIFTGTCGVIDTTSIPIGSVVTARRTLWADPGVLLGNHYIPDRVSTEVTLQGHFPNVLFMDVVSCMGITQTDQGRLQLQQRFGNVAENMEAFAVAWVCADHHIPCDIVLGVSNRIGPTAHDEWKAHHLAASRAAQTWITEHLA